MTFTLGDLVEMRVDRVQYLQLPKNVGMMWRDKLTEHAEAVVHGDNYDISIGGENAAIKHVPWAFHVGAAVDEQHHRLLTAVPDIWGTHTNTEGYLSGTQLLCTHVYPLSSFYRPFDK